MVFFVLSSFLIGYKAFHEVEATRRFDLKDYLEKRVLRIIPPLYFALVLLLLIYALIKFFHLFGVPSYRLPQDLYVLTERASVTWQMMLKCILLVPGDTDIPMNVALWSLSYEVLYKAILVNSKSFAKELQRVCCCSGT
jgi:peptidoglycan/LPS O-acetylase OafA/YrhL